LKTFERIQISEFDFKEFKASTGRHNIHDYPAMLHYLLVHSLIKKYSKKNSLIYDPFCGSGVSIVEALKLNRKAIGSDINPLALLISDVRASNFDIEKIKIYLEILKRKWNSLSSDIPFIKNIDYWFKKDVIIDLGKIRAFLKNITDDKVLKFFLVVFSQTARECSNNRKGEFKRYRLPEEKLKVYNPNVWETFYKLTNTYMEILKNEKLPFQHFSLFLHDVREKIPITNVDLIITSPPYGDSKTTVAYGQFSSFGFDWLKNLNPYGNASLKLDSLCLGGKKVKEEILLPSDYLITTIDKIKSIDRKRAQEVYSFYYDYFQSIEKIINTLNKNGYACFIVGNRTVKGVQINMDLITAEFLEYFGLNVKNILVRKISNKRMPLKNSPSNIAGKTSKTMLNEYIIIAKK